MKIRLTSKSVTFPYYKDCGESIAVFYDYTLFETTVGVPSLEKVFVALLGRTFFGTDARHQALIAIHAECERLTGKPVIIERSAMSTPWQSETRASVGLPESFCLASV